MNIRVLFVDDHPLVLDALRRATEADARFEVRGVADVREARAALEQFKPTVMVCDVRLPDGSGLMLLEQARANRTACLVLSSFDTPQYVATARRLGAAGYLLKTEATETIIAAIRAVAAGGTAFGLAARSACRATSRSAAESSRLCPR